MVTSPRQMPPMPEIGHPEGYYVRGAHDAEKKGLLLLRESFKVGQYITLALSSRIGWDEKLRYFHHALDRHATPPKILDDETWSFYKDLQNLIRDYAGEEALRLASIEDDRYAAMEAMSRPRSDIESHAELFFNKIICSDECPPHFHEDDYRQLKMIRDQWI